MIRINLYASLQSELTLYHNVENVRFLVHLVYKIVFEVLHFAHLIVKLKQFCFRPGFEVRYLLKKVVAFKLLEPTVLKQNYLVVLLANL